MAVRTPAATTPLAPPQPGAPATPRTPRRAVWRYWTVTLVTFALVLAAVAWSERVPAPLPASAPPTTFSAARAWPVVSLLADSIGHRVAGSPGAARAADLLVARLRAIPGVEVVVQDTTGVLASHLGQLVAYRTRNVLARIPGERPDAVLVSAHYDSPPESVGASDDAVAVGVVVELARALAAGPRLARTVVLNLNGAEEPGLLGAAGFVEHPWMRDVRAFVNLESAGPGGKAVLFQVGPREGWLAQAYARAVPHPYGSVVAQDIFQSGAIPSGTDFEVYTREGQVPGLDVAFYRDGYAYHTQLDRTDRVAPGSVQHMGADALAVVRALASAPAPDPRAAASRAVYYDVLGIGMLAYGSRTARALALLALLIGITSIALACRRFGLRASGVAWGALAALIGIALALLLALAGAAVVSIGFARAERWYAHPVPAVAGWGALALAGLLAPHWWWARRARRRGRPADDRTALAAWAGALALWLVALTGLTVAGIGSAYLVLAWTLPGAIGLGAIALARAARPRVVAWAASLPGALLAAQSAAMLLLLFVPVGGRFPLPFPFDLALAAMTALAVALLASMPIALAPRGRGLGAATLGALGIGVLCLVVSARQPPFDRAHPQRVIVVHEEEAGRLSASLNVRTLDFLGPRAALAALGADARTRVPTAPAGLPAPELSLLGDRSDSTGARELDLRVVPRGAYRVELEADAPGAGWSLAGATAPTARVPRLRLVAAPDTGWRLTLRVPRGTLPIRVKAAGYHDTTTPPTAALLARLPEWVNRQSLTVVDTTASF